MTEGGGSSWLQMASVSYCLRFLNYWRNRV